jgi:hypothetical protein
MDDVSSSSLSLALKQQLRLRGLTSKQQLRGEFEASS